MWKNLRLRPILASVLVLAFARGTFAADTATASAETSIYNYAGRMTITVGDCGSEELENFPLLIRLQESATFGYDLFHNDTNDIAFVDTTGKSLSYEIEKWDTAGESLIWVKVPRMSEGTTITMCWNLRDGCSKPRNDPADVWGHKDTSDYVGVWHMAKEDDSSPNQAAGTFGAMSSNRTDGVFGKARGATVTGEKGALLVADKTAALDNLNETGFTASFYLRLNSLNTDSAYLFSRKTTGDYPGWGLQFIDGVNSVRFHYTNNGQYFTKDLSGLVVNTWQRMDVVMTPDRQEIWIDGVKRCEHNGKSTFGVSDTGFSIGGLAGNGKGTLNGDIDEFRLRSGVVTNTVLEAEYAQGTNRNFCVAGVATNDETAVLKNGWKSEPTISQTVWEVGKYPTWDDFTIEPRHGDYTVTFFDRATGAATNDIPRAPGSYRVVITVAPSGSEQEGFWGPLEYTLGYRIAENEGTHEFNVNVARILLGNDDYTVDGGEVEWQSYDSEVWYSGLPYWRHLDSDGNDASTTYDYYWSDSYDFNLGGGTHHIYRYGDGIDRLWDLRDIRIGNTFNNGDEVWERTGRDEEYEEGLAKDQNYLPWNPASQRVLNATVEATVEGYHRYVGHIVMQNTTNAAVTSTCYTNGIGTIYFDAVNGWTDNITNAQGRSNYRLVVEIATNSTEDASLPPTEENISSGNAGLGVDVADMAVEPFRKANWVRCENLRVLHFTGEYCEDLGTKSVVDLKITEGGNYGCFYRVIVPVNLKPKTGGIRFRIRRETIDPQQQLFPDGTAYILLDNIICSEPAACVQLAPYGKYFPEKKRPTDIVEGWEGAFVPAYPSVTDAQVFGRAKATLPDGSAIPEGVIASATMHYRWHYLEQKTTDWLQADLVPETLVTRNPLVLPSSFQGDIDFWFDAVQHGHYYTYADYSGTDLGLGNSGYSEEISAVTNGVDKGWFVRTREGKSGYSELKLLVKTSENAAVAEMPLSIVQDSLWRGYYRMTNVFENGIWWRIEARNYQVDGATEWNWSTNRWYVLDWVETPPTFPASGRMSEGTTNSWCRMPCDMQTGYLMFQVDETSLGVTVIHSDYQAFDSWNDAHKGYFVGSSIDTNSTSMAGSSSDVREYSMSYASWADTPATNKSWQLNFNGHDLSDPLDALYPGYTTFPNWNNYFAAWQIGKGMWIYNKYLDPASHVALQMHGNGEGYAEFSNAKQIGNVWPRGLESVSFHSRIAQVVSLESAVFYDGEAPKRMTNYTFMVRGCFDQKNNEGFCGNAALSLFSYYKEKSGAYEARWEQIKGKITTNPNYPNEVLGPEPAGQRLVILRWNWNGKTYDRQELIATTNYTFSAWNVPMPLMNGNTSTNNLMPFLISTYHSDDATYVIAAVRIDVEGSGQASKGKGVAPNAVVANKNNRWYCVALKDTSAKRLKFGSYGVLTSNCEGMLVTPQFCTSPVWPEKINGKTMDDRYAVTTWNQCAGMNLKNYTYDYNVGFSSCVDDLVFDEDGYNQWTMDPDFPGRVDVFYDELSPTNHNFGFTYVKPYQTVNVLAKKLDSTEAWDVNKQCIGTVEITDFGHPGPEPDHKPMFYYTTDSMLRLQTGGGLDDYRTDVVINDIVIRQWRGYDSSDSRDQSSRNDHTNFVFTCGWITDGASQLSAKRTPVGTPCSIRSPLLDGYFGNGVGLGGIRFSYREPQTNINLLVQIATNLTQGSTDLAALTYSTQTDGDGNKTWHTVTNLTYADLWPSAPEKGDTRTWSQSFGYHGAKGLMRILVAPALVEDVSPLSWTNTAAFGAIDITAVRCFDEPAIDRYCWWGWNLQTVGDDEDSEKRMYLPDGASPDDKTNFGLSLALNNSVTDDIDPFAKDPNDFRKHMPFLQSPMFTNGIIGQISFKARKYENSDYAPAAQVVVYGAGKDKTEDQLANDAQWTFIAAFPITNTIYTTYTCKTDTENFRALRLAVVDVPGTPPRPDKPPPGGPAQRVMLDEVSVSEAVRAMLAFRNVGAFRSNLDDNSVVTGVTTSVQQPLCDENWGVQAEVFATMLGDEIDKTYTPRVKLHWYVGKEPWGFANWRKLETGSAWLAQADGSNYVFRSSYKTSPAAVMPAQTVPGTVVQYMLEVVYQTINSSTPGAKPTKALATNWLDAVSWKVPEWYAPVDYNADPEYGAGRTFAAFNILDTVAPGWAWLNEANVFGTKSITGVNSDEQFQYVEVCVPMESDLSGWRLRFLEAGVFNDTVTTNWIAKFGNSIWDQAAGKKKDNLGAKYNMVFRCLGNKESAQLSKANGTLDGVWKFSTYTSTFCDRNGVDCVYDVEMPFGVQLVRPTGIIESSIVIVGTNHWGRLPGYREYDPTNIVALLNKNVPGSKFFYAAEDCCGTFRSASVMDGRGESASVWTNNWACSPGYINTNWGGKVEQKINPLHPTPHGDSIIVYASVDLSGGPIRQWVGGKGSAQTNTTEMVILKKGSDCGTNILYQIGAWYELASVTTNGAAFWPYKERVRYTNIVVGVGASNNLTVVAKAQVDSDLQNKYGLTKDNPFTPAVMDWLHGGTDAYGNPFAHNGEIADPLAEYWDMGGTCVTNLTLTQMYCLDMDPTVSNLIFQAGMKIWPEVAGVDPQEEPVPGYKGRAALTNVKMRVFMMISNKVEDVYGRRAWSPYILRGLDPKFTSWDYIDNFATTQWTSETFKVTGILANGLTRETNYDNWIPLRWFVFDEDSFRQDEGDLRFTTDIEIIDPHSISSPGAAAGWYKWCQEHGYTPIFNRWAIDMRLKPVSVEILQPTNFYSSASSPL